MPVGNPPVLLYRYQNQVLTALPANAAETALTSTPLLQADLPGAMGQQGPPVQPVKISGVLNLLAGAGTTAVVIRVRQGVGLAGAIVGGTATFTLAAASSASVAFAVEDTTGVVQAGTAYTVTISQTGATGAGTVNTFDWEVTA